MREGKILKGMEKMNWYKSKRGGEAKREAKDKPDMVKETISKWTGKGKKRRQRGEKPEGYANSLEEG